MVEVQELLEEFERSIDGLTAQEQVAAWEELMSAADTELRCLLERLKGGT